MIFVLDNYDSFTYNLVQRFGEIDASAEILVARNDQITLAEIPILGVCLGHQCMAEVYGAQVVRAKRLMHGKTSEIHHDGKGVFAGLPNPFTATRYHSLVVPEETLTAELVACGWTRDADHPSEIMAMRHARYPVHGVQFHPESFLTDSGIELLKNFLRMPKSPPK